eukprot:m.335236 g.335236  ORF g.335236 m.335236 type:complete len:293 (-) comp17544_c0_seq1:42-920(-)
MTKAADGTFGSMSELLNPHPYNDGLSLDDVPEDDGETEMAQLKAIFRDGEWREVKDKLLLLDITNFDEFRTLIEADDVSNELLREVGIDVRGRAQMFRALRGLADMDEKHDAQADGLKSALEMIALICAFVGGLVLSCVLQTSYGDLQDAEKRTGYEGLARDYAMAGGWSSCLFLTSLVVSITMYVDFSYYMDKLGSKAQFEGKQRAGYKNWKRMYKWWLYLLVVSCFLGIIVTLVFIFKAGYLFLSADEVKGITWVPIGVFAIAVLILFYGNMAFNKHSNLYYNRLLIGNL